MEGIEHNPVVYELMSEMAFRDEKVDVQVHNKHTLATTLERVCSINF